MECNEPRNLSLRPSVFFFPTALLIFTAAKLFHQVMYERPEHKASTEIEIKTVAMFVSSHIFPSIVAIILLKGAKHL